MLHRAWDGPSPPRRGLWDAVDDDLARFQTGERQFAWCVFFLAGMVGVFAAAAELTFFVFYLASPRDPLATDFFGAVSLTWLPISLFALPLACAARWVMTARRGRSPE